MVTETVVAPTFGFEGSEKRIEVDFKRKPSSGVSSDNGARQWGWGGTMATRLGPEDRSLFRLLMIAADPPPPFAACRPQASAPSPASSWTSSAPLRTAASSPRDARRLSTRTSCQSLPSLSTLTRWCVFPVFNLWSFAPQDFSPIHGPIGRFRLVWTLPPALAKSRLFGVTCPAT